MTVTNGVSATEAARLKRGSVWRAPAPWTVLMGNVVCVFRAGTVEPWSSALYPLGKAGPWSGKPRPQGQPSARAG